MKQIMEKAASWCVQVICVAYTQVIRILYVLEVHTVKFTFAIYNEISIIK